MDEVAATFFMSPRTIEHYISKCLNTGDVNSEKLGRPFNSFAMHPHVELVIMEAILEQPDTTLAVIAYNVFEQTGSENAVSSILQLFFFFFLAKWFIRVTILTTQIH